MTTLVIGATGRTASHLARRLAQDGHRVRALVRDAGKAETALQASTLGIEVVAGAFDDPAVLARAYDGVESAFLALGTSPSQVALEKALIDGAARAQLPHLVRMSVLGAERERDTATYEVARRHGELDAHLAASGVPHTLLRPAWFMSNLLARTASIAADSRWFGAAPTGRVAMIDTRDVADAAAAVILAPALRGRAYDLTGPESLTFAQAAARLGAVLGREIRYVPMTEDALAAATAARAPAWLVDIVVGIDRGMEAGLHAELTSQVHELAGHAPRSFDDFARDHRAAFGGQAAAPL